jgi:hypothetical protein
VPVVVFAAGPVPVPRLMDMIMGVSVTVIVVTMAVVIMAMVVMVMMAVIMPAIMLVYAIRLEGTHHARSRASLSADEFGESGIVLDVQRIRRHLRRRVTIADLIRNPHQAKGILGLDLQERLGRSLNPDEASIFELHGIAVLQHRGLVEIQKEIEATLALEHDTAALPPLVVERHGIGDPIRPNGGLADDGSGTKHGGSPEPTDQGGAGLADRNECWATGSTVECPPTTRSGSIWSSRHRSGSRPHETLQSLARPDLSQYSTRSALRSHSSKAARASSIGTCSIGISRSPGSRATSS